MKIFSFILIFTVSCSTTKINDRSIASNIPASKSCSELVSELFSVQKINVPVSSKVAINKNMKILGFNYDEQAMVHSMIDENPDIETYANNLFSTYVKSFLPAGRFTDSRFTIESLRERILKQFKKTFNNYLGENEKFFSAQLFEELGVKGLRHRTDAESFIAMVTGHNRGLKLGNLTTESVSPGIYATLDFGYYPGWKLIGENTGRGDHFQVIIDIDLEYINQIKRKFIINPGWDWGKEGDWSYQLDQGEEALKKYIKELMLNNKHDNEIVFRDDNLDLSFFKQVYAISANRDWILQELRKNGIRTINGRDIEAFVILKL
jgi:hypothetical protein